MSETTTKTARRVRQYHHGRTPAGWAGTTIALVGFVLGAASFLLGPDWRIFWAGAGVIVLSLVVTAVLRGLGFGQA